jgi:hypothetical protein
MVLEWNIVWKTTILIEDYSGLTQSYQAKVLEMPWNTFVSVHIVPNPSE